MIAVKICGLKTSAMLAYASTCGAAYVGFVYFPGSPRHLDIPDIASLVVTTSPHVKSTVVLVNPDNTTLDALFAACRPDVLQLHGSEPPERIEHIRNHYNTQILKAIPVGNADDVAHASIYKHSTDMLLFDAKPPKNATLPGGMGVCFDWQLLADQKPERPFGLSGGLCPQNVAQAIRISGATMVDVSSGVESAPGVKDPELIDAFITAAKSA